MMYGSLLPFWSTVLGLSQGRVGGVAVSLATLYVELSVAVLVCPAGK